MKNAVRTSLIIVALAPMSAHANSSTMHVGGVIPVQCELGASNTVFNGQAVGANYSLYCNTSHALIIDASPGALAGGAEIEIDGQATPFNGHAEMHVGYGPLQRQGYIRIRLAAPTEERIAELAQSLQISVRTN